MIKSATFKGMADTKQQTLDAVTCLFAGHGTGAVPLRRIVAEASELAVPAVRRNE